MHLDSDEDTYPLLLETHKQVASILAAKFPNTMIVPVFGNNDNEYHDNPEPLEDDQSFYSLIYDLWFDELPGNNQGFSEE